MILAPPTGKRNAPVTALLRGLRGQHVALRHLPMGKLVSPARTGFPKLAQAIEVQDLAPDRPLLIPMRPKEQASLREFARLHLFPTDRRKTGAARPPPQADS